MIVRQTKPEEARRVNELFSIAFETDAKNGPADPKNERIRHWAAFSETGEMMSTLSVTEYTVRFDGTGCKMGGVGAVATLPPWRRQGGIRACFGVALPQLYREGYDFSYLYPFSTAYYRRFGYESCVRRLACRLDLTQLEAQTVRGSFRLAEESAPLTEQVRTVDRLWEARYNMAVLHRQEDYTWAETCAPTETREYLYVWFDAAAAPKAYTVFHTENRPEGRSLVCTRFCFVDREGFAGLLEIFRSLSADHRYARFELPDEPALFYLLPEWSLGAVEWTVKSAGMVRVVNVRSVLEKARYQGSGELRLRIRDALINENDGCFYVRFIDGRAELVEPTKAKSDAELEISAFSALIAGVCDFAEAADWMCGVQITHPEAPLSALFYRKPLMITDYF